LALPKQHLGTDVLPSPSQEEQKPKSLLQRIPLPGSDRQQVSHKELPQRNPAQGWDQWIQEHHAPAQMCSPAEWLRIWTSMCLPLQVPQWRVHRDLPDQVHLWGCQRVYKAVCVNKETVLEVNSLDLSEHHPNAAEPELQEQRPQGYSLQIWGWLVRRERKIIKNMNYQKWIYIFFKICIIEEYFD